jgi:uncharacterized protein with von Willebrand factor type A (vWA) domain
MGAMADATLVIDSLDGLVDELHAIGVPVSTTEKVDAIRALLHLPANRSALRSGLGSALVKQAGHVAAFDSLFDLFFGTDAPGVGLSALDDEGLRCVLETALVEDSPVLLRAVASAVVDRHAGIEPGRQVAGAYYAFRALRALGAVASSSAFRAEVEAEIRRRLIADRGAADVARTLRTPLPEDADFLTASPERIAEMRSVVAPLARALAARLSAKHHVYPARALNFRKTMRRSLSLGGVPASPAFRPPRAVKPRVVVLADISASVATFAAFTLQLIYALRAELAGLRAFVFVDGVQEITDLLLDSDDIGLAVRRINGEARGVGLEASSDYGGALQQFWEEHGNELGWRTIVVVLGDGRGNYLPPRLDIARAIARRAGYLYWINPEPRAIWGTGDSVIDRYAQFCDGVFECRNLRQLRHAVAAIAHV